eukprot:jgi/Hompol1/4444/HPOL_000206-RA
MSADELFAAGTKALNKTTFFGKAKPDYDDALINFEQAANLYRSQKAFAKAVESFEKVAFCHKNLNSLFLAAKAFETAANLLAQNMNDAARAGPMYQQASLYFVTQGSPDRGGEMLEKAAKMYETVDPAKAIEFYSDSTALYEEEDRLRFGIDTFKRAIAFCVRINR